MSENKEKKEKKFDITFDTSQTNEIIRENERLKIEKEQREGKTESSLADLKIQAIQKFGRADLFLQAETKEMLSSMLTNYINELAEQNNPTQTPSGSAPLNDAQYGRGKEDLYRKKYSSQSEMVNDLVKKSHEGNEEAQSYLNSLLKKYMLDKKNSPERVEGFHNPNSPEALAELDLVQKGEVLTPRDPNDGDIGKILHAWKLERLARMKKGSETQ